MYRHLLVPVDETEISARNVSAAVEFARDAGARVTFFHANADYAASDDGALMHAMSPATFADQAAGHGRAILAKAEAAGRAAGVTCRGVSTVSDKPAQAIVSTAEREGCDLIFMASHGPTSIGGIMLGSQTLIVLAHASIPVLVSSVAQHAAHAPRDAALATIRDEHRSIAAVLDAVRHLLAKDESGGPAVDTRLLHGAIHYLRAFPGTLHHPKEEAYLFTRLRNRSPQVGHVLDDLERQHAESSLLLGAVADAMATCERQPRALPALRQAWDAFATHQWKHMQAEEQVILPAARELLAADDWRDIAEAFGRNGDPRFDRVVADDFRALLARIMNLLPSSGEQASVEMRSR